MDKSVAVPLFDSVGSYIFEIVDTIHSLYYNIHIYFLQVKVKMSSDKISSPFCSTRKMGSPLGNFMFEYKQTIVILISMCILFFVTFYGKISNNEKKIMFNVFFFFQLIRITCNQSSMWTLVQVTMHSKDVL